MAAFLRWTRWMESQALTADDIAEASSTLYDQMAIRGRAMLFLVNRWQGTSSMPDRGTNVPRHAFHRGAETAISRQLRFPGGERCREIVAASTRRAAKRGESLPRVRAIMTPDCRAASSDFEARPPASHTVYMA